MAQGGTPRGSIVPEDRKLQEVLEFWVISAPGEKTCQQTWEALSGLVQKQGVGQSFKFHIPDLKVGTLDVLVGLSDELAKLDVYVESVVKKIAGYASDVLEKDKDKVKENLTINGMSLGSYLTKFQWDMAKYPIKQSLKNISDIIAKQSTQLDTDLKAKAQAYNNLKGNLQNLERKQTGSLLTRSLADIVKKEDVVTDSEYLITLLVAVPNSSYKDWWAKYERLADMVVPQSSKLIFEDSEHGIFTVTLFRKVIDEYKLHCRENKFIVRDFIYNDGEVEASKSEMARLTSEKDKQFGPLVRWLKLNFAEAFVAWVHVKALRIYVESVMRYGLPVNFQAMVLAPPRRQQKKLRELLNEHYAHLDNSGTQEMSKKAEIIDIPGLSSSDYYPYVYTKIQVDMVEQMKS